MTQPIAPAGKLKGTALIWIGVLAMIAGVVGGIVMVVSGAVDLAHVAEGYQRVPASGGTIALDEEGRYNVFYETYDPSSSSTYYEPVPGFVRVTDPEGVPVPTSTAPSSLTYNNNGRRGVRIATFRAGRPGRYGFRLIRSDGVSTSGADARLAVGKSDFSGARTVAIGAVLGAALFLLGLILLIVGAVRRSSSKKARLAASGYPGGTWAPSAPGAAWGTVP